VKSEDYGACSETPQTLRNVRWGPTRPMALTTLNDFLPDYVIPDMFSQAITDIGNNFTGSI